MIERLQQLSPNDWPKFIKEFKTNLRGQRNNSIDNLLQKNKSTQQSKKNQTYTEPGNEKKKTRTKKGKGKIAHQTEIS